MRIYFQTIILILVIITIPGILKAQVIEHPNPYYWEKTFGGSGHDSGQSVQQTADSGFIIAGVENEFEGGDETAVYLIKTDGNGNEQWSKTFGGSGHDSGQSVQQTDDGGFIIAGITHSIYGDGDVYLIKTDSSGNEQWCKTFGGSDHQRRIFSTANR